MTPQAKYDQASTDRDTRGRDLALRRGDDFVELHGRWSVPASGATADRHIVDLTVLKCTCEDYGLRGGRCAHLHAVEYWIAWDRSTEDVMSDDTPPPRKPSYPQNWPAYEAAQANERAHVEQMLRALCDGIQELPRETGRIPHPLGDRVFAAVMKIYSGMSTRRAQCDRDTYYSRSLTNAPIYRSAIFRTLECPSTTPVLQALIADSAAPMKEIETQFAEDGSGFPVTTYGRWQDIKKKAVRSRREYAYLHIVVGTNTHIVTSARVDYSHDSVMLPEMLRATVDAGFKVKEFSADKGYLAHTNLAAITAVGATPYIPFKINSRGRGSLPWRKMWAEFVTHREEWLQHYHRRSNVETTFHMMKAKFGANVRSKLPVARENEILSKVLLHNLCCLIQAHYELGLTPNYWQESPSSVGPPQLRVVRP